MSPLIPILVLLAGAALVAIGVQLKFRYTPIVQLVAVALGGVALGLVGRTLPQATVLLAWRPISLFGTPVVLNVDGYAWALSISMLVLILAASLRWLTQPDGLAQPEESPFYPALVLAMSAVMLMVAGADNLLTLALAWGSLDVVYCITLLAREGQAASRRTELVIGLNGIATLAVWVAVIFLQQEGFSPYWHLMALSPVVRTLLGLAAILRLGLYPLYAWSSSDQARDVSQPILLNLMPMVAGVTLWIRLAAVQAIPVGDVWVGTALVGAILAGLLAWVQPDARQAISYVAIGYAGLMIVAGSGGGLTAANLTQGVAAWLLGIYALASSCTPTLGPPLSPRLRGDARGDGEGRGGGQWAAWLWRLPALIALAALLGLPMTAGMAYRMALHTGLSEMRWLWWGLAVLAEILLAGAALRCALAQVTPIPIRRMLLIAPVAGLGVAALPLIILGVWPAILFGSQARALGVSDASISTLSTRGWIGWLLPWIGMTALAIASRFLIGNAPLRSTLDRWGKTASRVLDLGWLYDLAMNSIRRSARWISSLAALTEGKAALIWMLLFIVLALLYLREPGR